MSRIAFLFPGQGSQKVGMGRDFFDRFSLAREIFDQADAILGFKLSTICFSGPEEKLKMTEYTQPALLTVSYIGFRLLQRDPDLAAGHSLGEYSALVAAGCLTFEDALRLVHKRGLYMQEAVPFGLGAMAAILGSSYQAIREALAGVTRGVVEIANWNSDDQIVISGDADAVKEALTYLPGARAVMLPVSAPFHCRLMKSAEERLAVDLDQVAFRDLRFPIITNVDSQLILRGEEARSALKRQVSRPVLWQSTMETLGREGVETVVELGSGKILLGLLKRSSRSWPRQPQLLNVEDGDTLTRCQAVLSGAA